MVVRPAMRILLINPNTTESITARLAATAAATAPQVDFVTAGARFGGRYISSRAGYAIAGHAVLDAWAAAEGPFDATVIACFGDPGLDALRELSDRPVIGMADASLHAALQVGRRISIVTGGERWESMLRDFVAFQGMAARVASIRTVRPTGAQIALSPETAVPLLVQACEQCVADGAEAIVIGGAGLVGLKALIGAHITVPLIDGFEAAVAMAIAMATVMPTTHLTGSSDTAPESTALSLPLAKALR